jgi:hypothetical protein
MPKLPQPPKTGIIPKINPNKRLSVQPKAVDSCGLCSAIEPLTKALRSSIIRGLIFTLLPPKISLHKL